MYLRLPKDYCSGYVGKSIECIQWVLGSLNTTKDPSGDKKVI